MGWSVKALARLRIIVLLGALLVAACARPGAALTPPAGPPETPAPSFTAAAAPSAALPTKMARPTMGQGSAPTPDPTLEAFCAQPGMSDMPECVARHLDLRPLPSASFAEALGQFPRRSLIFQIRPGFLMLGDPDSGATLWLSGEACPSRTTRDVFGQWSADGEYIAFTCQDNRRQGAIHLLTLSTGATLQVAQGDAVDFAWSPRGHQLLIAEHNHTSRGLLLDAQTGATTPLPVAPFWEGLSGPASGVTDWINGWYIDQPRAAMAWSPDGARIAIANSSIVVLDDTLAELATFGNSTMLPPFWSADGCFVYAVVPHQNHSDPLAPSSMWGSIVLRLEVSTGASAEADPHEPIWSPDRAWYVAQTEDDGPWSLYSADGTAVFELPPSVYYPPDWSPDSREVLVRTMESRGTSLALVDLAGGVRTLLSTDDNIGYWRQYGSPFSADGELIALANMTTGHVVVYDLDGQLRAAFGGSGGVGWRN